MSKIEDGLKEAVAFAKGEAPAARLTINGYAYVPEVRPAPNLDLRRQFLCVFTDGNAHLSTSIAIDVPSGLTRQQAIDFVTGRVAAEVARYAASEAMGFGPFDQSTDWTKIVT